MGDSSRLGSPRRSARWGICAIHFAHFLLLLEDFGLQLQHLTPHSILLTLIFVHLFEMFVGVRPCVILFRYFFVLVKSGRSKDEVGGTTSR